MRIHPNEEALQDLFRQQESGALRMLEHVLGCPACRERAQGVLAAERRSGAGNVLLLPAEDYDSIIESSIRALGCRQLSLEQERREARALFPSLEACPLERRRLLLYNSSRYQTWGVLEQLLERSWQASFGDPRQVDHWAHLALSLADRLDAELYGHPQLEDMRARAWSYIANARRIRSELDDAEEAFETAFSHLRVGTGDPVERASLLDLKASLRKIQRRFDDAFALTRRAISIFRESGEKRRVGKALLQLATIYEHAGSPEEGIPLLYEAMQLIDGSQEPRLLLFVRHTLSSLLADMGRSLEAKIWMARTEPLYREFSSPRQQYRRKWVLGKIARGMGCLGEAEEHFLAAYRGFVADGDPYDTALVSLDLARLYREQRRIDEIKPLAEEVISYFGSLHIDREVQRALALLQAAESGIA